MLESTKQEVAAMAELARRSVPAAGDKPYLIDESDPDHYRPIAA